MACSFLEYRFRDDIYVFVANEKSDNATSGATDSSNIQAKFVVHHRTSTQGLP